MDGQTFPPSPGALRLYRGTGAFPVLAAAALSLFLSPSTLAEFIRSEEEAASNPGSGGNPDNDGAADRVVFPPTLRRESQEVKLLLH